MSLSGLRSARLLAAGTALRIVLTPVVMALVLDGSDRPPPPSSCSRRRRDRLGRRRLARRWGVTTKLGSFLDTTADKLLVTGVLIALVAVDRASPWIALIIIGRELVILGLRGVIAAEGTVMQPSMLGKLKTTIQFLAIALAILRPGGTDRRPLPRRVGDARRRRHHRLVGRRLPAPLLRPPRPRELDDAASSSPAAAG
jgi:hypothetical protein